MTKVAIIMGSDSDLPVMVEAEKVLKELEIDCDTTVVSAHRTPDRLVEFSKTAHENNYSVIIAGAGGAAHLPGMVAAFSPLPVIGVPVKSSNMSGIDSLYSIVQMPPGVPVATVAINGAKNAGILAASIIGSADKVVQNKMIDFKASLKDKVLGSIDEVESLDFSMNVTKKA